MRKVVLFGLALALSASVVAQTNLRSAVKHTNDLKKQKEVSKDDPAVAGPTIPWNRPNVTVPKGTSDLTLVPLFSSVNVYSVLLGTQNALDYNQDINTVMFSARGGGNVGTTVGTSNDIVTAMSNDGISFLASVSAPGTTAERYRYPSGVLYNPAGNTDPNNAFKLFQAPITSGSGWILNRFTTVSYDGASIQTSDVALPTGIESPLVRESLAAYPNGTAIATATYTEDDGTNYTLKQPRFYKGTFDATTKVFNFAENNLEPEVPCYNPTYKGLYPVAAFDNSGMVGYYVVIGDDGRSPSDEHRASLQPIVYKTTDGGATWTIMDFIDLFNHPALANNPNCLLRGSRQGDIKLLWDEVDAVVDINGGLHIFGTVTSVSSNSIDSTFYTWNLEAGGVIELFNPYGDNNWMVNWVANLQTQIVDAEVSGYGSGTNAQGWDMRLQAGKSADGNYVYAIWTDTDTAFWGLSGADKINLYPDVFGYAHRVNDNVITPAVNFTSNSDFLGDNYYIFASQHCMVNGGDITIPVTNSDIKFNNNPDQAVGHRYITGITFTADQFVVGVNEVAKNISNVQVYPNPANSEATINFTMEKAANVDIQITNILGQTVYSTRIEAAAGANTTTIDVASYKAGMYFYTMIANGQKTTGKISVR